MHISAADVFSLNPLRGLLSHGDLQLTQLVAFASNVL